MTLFQIFPMKIPQNILDNRKYFLVRNLAQTPNYSATCSTIIDTFSKHFYCKSLLEGFLCEFVCKHSK